MGAEPCDSPAHDSHRQAERNRPQEVLVVVGQSGMGDAIEALPVFELIAESKPGVRLAAGYFREKQRAILETSPYLSRAVQLFGGVRYASKSAKHLRDNFRAMRPYDQVLFLYKKPVITWPIVLAAKLGRAKALYRHGHGYRSSRKNVYSDFPEHVFFQIVASELLLGSPLARLKVPTVYLSYEDGRFTDEFFRRNGLGRDPVVIFNINTWHPDPHDWKLENYARVAEALMNWGADVVVNGGDRAQVRQFGRFARLVHGSLVLLERPSPRELAAVISRCSLFVGAPNGPASLAMAVGTPTVILVGRGEHDYPGQERIGPVWWPRDPKHRIISRIEWCRLNMGTACTCHTEPERWSRTKRAMKHLGVHKPWKKIRSAVLRRPGRARQAPRLRPCFDAITVDEVVEAAIGQLSQRRTRGNGERVRVTGSLSDIRRGHARGEASGEGRA